MRLVSEMTEQDKTFLENIGQLYLECREEAKLTQREAALRADSAPARVSYLENGRAEVGILTLQKWAAVYGYQIEFNLIPLHEEAEPHVDSQE